MSYFEIGIFQPVFQENVGTLWRSAYQLGASGLFVIGKKPRLQVSDPLDTKNELPFRVYPTWEDFLKHRPLGARLIAVEIGGKPLSMYKHPEQAVYIFGSEKNGLPPYIPDQCNEIVEIDSLRYTSYNVAAAGSILLYHRQLSLNRFA